MTEGPDDPGHSRRVLLLAYLGSVTALTGVQLITPALPAIQQALDLTDPQVGLVTSLFLLPGVVLSVPIGFITERVGRRVVYSYALLIMGAGGIVLLFVHDIGVFFAVRLLQGVAFAAILPTTITLIGDVAVGPEQLRAQGRRSIAMAAGDSGFPLLGGALVGLSWFAPFAVQLIALPLAVAGWRIIGDPPPRTRPHPTLRSLAGQMRNAIALSLQVAGFLRFLFKFAILSYLPILLHGRGASILLISLSLSAVAGSGVVSAWVAPRLVRHARPSVLLAVCLVTIGVTIALIAVVPAPAIALPAMVVLGFADVLYAVLQNAVLVTAVTDDSRASFVAATGAVRNLGKFAAPTLIGALLLIVELEQAFLLLSIVALVAVPTALPVRRLDAQLAGQAGGAGAATSAH